MLGPVGDLQQRQRWGLDADAGFGKAIADDDYGPGSRQPLGSHNEAPAQSILGRSRRTEEDRHFPGARSEFDRLGLTDAEDTAVGGAGVGEQVLVRAQERQGQGRSRVGWAPARHVLDDGGVGVDEGFDREGGPVRAQRVRRFRGPFRRPLRENPFDDDFSRVAAPVPVGDDQQGSPFTFRESHRVLVRVGGAPGLLRAADR